MQDSARTVEAQMLIRKPAATVFQAFIDPALTKNFWFTNASGSLEEGKTVTWEWEMYGVSTMVSVQQIVPSEKIVIHWGEPSTTVEFIFKPVTENSTYVIIKNYGFDQPAEELLPLFKDLTGGFTTVLDGLKAFLEHNINLNLIADKFSAGEADHKQP
ncbi:MAG: SRPBCC family protein [Bacteroidota bacterium]|nr:SRPBCC family protein [Ferruginibacter sp.]